jgi:hypothetical protein
MSRYLVSAHDATLVVTVGWDPPLQTFFGQVMHPAASAEQDDTCVLWVGTQPQEIPTVAQLWPHLHPYADIPLPLHARLTRDQASSPPPTALQVRMWHVLEQQAQQQGRGGWGYGG